MQVIGAGLGDDVYNAAGSAAEFGSGAAGHHLKFLNCIQGNVDGCTLTACLFSEEAVVVITTVEADVVEDAALAGKTDFVAVRALNDGHTRSQGKQVLKFSSQHRCLADRKFIQGCAGLGLRSLNGGSTCDFNGLTGGRDLQCDAQVNRLTDREIQILLDHLGEAGLGGRDRLASGVQRQKDKTPVRICLLSASCLCIEVPSDYIGASKDGAGLVERGSLNNSGCNL